MSGSTSLDVDRTALPASGIALPADSSSRAVVGPARRLATAAVLVACVLLPVFMTVANKSSPLLLGVAAALANAAALVAGRRAQLLRAHLGLLRGGSGLLILAGIALAAASVGWSTDRAMSLRGLREALPEIVFAWSFAAAGICVLRPKDAAVLRYGLVLAAAAIGLEALLGMPLHRLVGARAEPYDLKWSALTLALLLWPAIGPGLRRGERAWPIAVLAAIALAALAAHSATALCAAVVSTLVYAAARWAPRATIAALALVLFTALLVSPWAGRMAGEVVSPDLRTRLEQQHAEHRIEIWTAFGNRIGERLWFGHGFNSSFGIGRRDDPAEAAIVASHPHNAFLQIWIEFGLAGVIGAAVVIAHLLGRLRTLPVAPRAARIAQLGAVLILGLVWQNPWRPWWLAAIGLSMALFVIDRLHAHTVREDDGLG